VNVTQGYPEDTSIALRMGKMSADQILLTGSSGLIGTSLVRSLHRNRISTITLSRRPAPGAPGTKTWDPYAAVPISPGALDGTTAAVHLSGANLAGHRWTSAYKREIRDSRITPTRALATMLAKLQPKPAVLVSASAIGIYGDQGDEVLSGRRQHSQPQTLESG
jgi:NAD dependent epimerase/dehydratase family enzyme